MDEICAAAYFPREGCSDTDNRQLDALGVDPSPYTCTRARGHAGSHRAQSGPFGWSVWDDDEFFFSREGSRGVVPRNPTVWAVLAVPGEDHEVRVVSLFGSRESAEDFAVAQGYPTVREMPVYIARR